MQNQNFHFIYQGIQYDATSYASKHPGGLKSIQNMKNVTHDFTQYFRALHSNQAQKILKSFPILSIKGSSSKSSKQYMAIYQKVEQYFQPLWYIQILLFAFISLCWITGCLAQSSVVSIPSFAIAQILIGWVGHSCDHNRNQMLRLFGRFESALLGGFSAEWWGSKHNMHHMFTNIQKYDQDIQHAYKVYLFQFLFLKWRFDSLISAITNFNTIQLVGIILNYTCLIFFYQNILHWLIAQLISGFIIAFVLIGNHQKQKRYQQKPDVSFIDHQIQTSRNYRQENVFWLLFMGGMQYQTQHHLFPQIPFYRLPQAKQTIKRQCQKLGKSFIYGPVI